MVYCIAFIMQKFCDSAVSVSSLVAIEYIRISCFTVEYLSVSLCLGYVIQWQYTDSFYPKKEPCPQDRTFCCVKSELQDLFPQFAWRSVTGLMFSLMV